MPKINRNPKPSTNGHAFRKYPPEGISPELEALKKEFEQCYYFSDGDIIDVVLGIVAGNHIDSDPIWLHVIGPPSGGKTELLYSLFNCDETFYLSDFTANSLISGYKNEGKDEDKSEEYSLLPQLDGKVVITKDFSLIHDKPSETRSQILSILRDAYDGYASRALGNSATKGFHSRFNYITGMTPDIEKSWSLNTLGERFLMYRIQIEDRRAHAVRALRNTLDTDKGTVVVREKLQGLVKGFMDQLEPITPTVNDDMLERIIDLADVVTTCRTYVHRDRNDEIPCLPQAELCPRVAKQLMRVGQSVAAVRGRKIVTDAEFRIMKRIALDSLPTNRLHLLKALYKLRGAPNELKVFTDEVSRITKTTVRRELKNLAELNGVDCKTRQKGKTRVDTFRLADNFIKYCDNIGGV